MNKDLQHSNQQNNQPKLLYLQQQIQNLEEENLELKNLLNLNKDVIRNLQKDYATLTTRIAIDSGSLTSPITKSDDKMSNQAFLKLLEENSKVYKKLDAVILQRNESQSQLFVYQQMIEAAQQREQETILDLQEKIKFLTSKLKEKENQHQSSDLCDRSNIMNLDIETFNLQQENTKMLNQINKLNAMVARQKHELNELLVINSVFGSKIQTLQQNLKDCKCTDFNQENIQQDYQFDIIKAQKKAVFENESNSENSEEDIDNLPIKIFQNQQQHNPFHVEESNSQNEVKSIPKLDLTKAKKIQQINIKRLQEQQQNEHESNGENLVQVLHYERNKLLEKVKNLEKENDELKGKLEDNFINSRMKDQELEENKKFIEEILITNDTLIQGYQNYEKKWKQIWKKFIGYEQYWQSMRNQWRSGRVNDKLLFKLTEEALFEYSQIGSRIESDKLNLSSIN